MHGGSPNLISRGGWENTHVRGQCTHWPLLHVTDTQQPQSSSSPNGHPRMDRRLHHPRKRTPSTQTIPGRPHQRRSQTQQSQRHARIRARNRLKDRMDRILDHAQDGGARETRGPRGRRDHRPRRCGARFLFTSRLLIISVPVYRYVEQTRNYAWCLFCAAD